MSGYSELLQAVLLQEDLFRVPQPSTVLEVELAHRVRAASDESLSANARITNRRGFALVRGAAFYGLDALAEAHAIFQEATGDLGSYWHGMLHRREGDFDNARYWFRRAGTLPCFSKLHAAAAGVSVEMARQPSWDPYLLTYQCEQARFGAVELREGVRLLQKVEFELLLDYCWRQSTAAGQPA